jgi:hypothetical protein
MVAADAVTAASRLGGRPVLALRISGGDERGRHRGVSHHASAVLSVCGESCKVAWPRGCPFEPPDAGDCLEVDVTNWRTACDGLRLEHMTRGPDDDPWFFAAGFAAGRLARELLDA